MQLGPTSFYAAVEVQIVMRRVFSKNYLRLAKYFWKLLMVLLIGKKNFVNVKFAISFENNTDITDIINFFNLSEKFS